MANAHRFFRGLIAVAAMALAGADTPAAARNFADASGASLPSAYFHPTVLYFKVGTTSTQTTILTNNSAATLIIHSFGLTGTNQNNFSFTTTCGSTLAAGHSCTVSVSYMPTTAGSLGELIEYDNSAAGRHSVSLQAK